MTTEDPDQFPLWISAHEAPDWTGVPAGTVRSWAGRNKLLARGLDDAGRPLYATRDILRLRRNSQMPSSERCAS